MIAEVVRGEAPSLMEADKANEIIGAINGMMTSTAADPLTLVIDSDGKMNLSLNITPFAGNVVINGVIEQKIFFVQDEVSEE